MQYLYLYDCYSLKTIKKLTTKSLGTTTEKELENRLHLLTENLIQKQTLIEALQSEKHSIFLQLERSEVKNTIILCFLLLYEITSKI